MEIKKKSENLSRVFDSEGAATDTVSNAQYDILGDDGNRIGQLDAWQGGASLTVNVSAPTIAESVAKAREILHIDD